jgi:trimeric autotransporter adhesin
VRPLPFANVTNGGSKVTDAAGNYTYSGGTATSTLNGKYFRMSDACGSISLSNSSTGNLAFGTSGGTDCTTPGVGGAGNTHASRTGFYHLTNINRKAASFLVGNAWLASTVTANMNINQTCNAFWNGSTVNFYRSGGGCSNTGEIAAVFLHEWGHGMDTNSGGAASDKGTGEAVGDTFAFIETKDPCIGKNFRPGVACTNCNASCTGVRDMASFASGGSHTIARPSNVTSNTGINCDRYACPYTSGISAYQGPMGYEGHCESYIASTANWDLAQQLIAHWGTTTGWQKMDAIWYKSLTPSKSAYRVVSGGKCNPAAVVDGCGSTNWYTVFLSADDNDGNLANGTPNGCRIWDAYNAHGIACGARPVCTQ